VVTLESLGAAISNHLDRDTPCLLPDVFEMTFEQSLLKRHIPYRISGDRLKVSVCCPFCPGGDNKFRLAIHVKLGWGKCLHCNWTRRQGVFAVLRQFGITEAVEGFDKYEAAPEERVELPTDFQTLTHATDDLDRQALQYILKRGITKEQIRDYRIGVSYTGRYAYRIVFPLYAKVS